MRESSIKSQFLIILAAMLWGTTGSAQALAPVEATPLVVGVLRMLIGGSTLLIIAIIRGSMKGWKDISKPLLLTASICMALYQPFFFSGVCRTGIALGTVLALGSAPIFAGIIEFFMRKGLSKKWVLGTSVSIVGCILLFGGQGSLDFDIFGSLFSLGAGLAYSIYVQVSQKLFNSYKRDAVNGLVFFIGALFLVPLLFINDISWLTSLNGALSMLHLGLIATALAYTLFAYGLVNVATAKAVSLTLAEPLTATLLGIFIFQETFSKVSMLGGLILLIGLIINTIPAKTKHFLVNDL